MGDQLVARAEEEAAGGRTYEARSLFLRAAAVYRIARFPINRSPLSQEAWQRGKAAYEKGGALLDPPSAPVAIPFSHADPSAGDDGGALLHDVRTTSAKPVAIARTPHVIRRRLVPGPVPT